MLFLYCIYTGSFSVVRVLYMYKVFNFVRVTFIYKVSNTPIPRRPRIARKR